MKQKLRLWASYGLKRTQPEYLLCLQSLLKVLYILTGYVAPMLRKCTHTIVHYQYFTCTLPVLETRSSFLRTFFSLCSNFSRAVCGVDASRIREILAYRPHTAGVRPAIWENTGRGKAGEGVCNLRKAQPVPCSSPPSLTLPSLSVPMCPTYTSVKRPKSDTLANVLRLYSGRKAYTAGYGWATVQHWVGYGNTLVRQLLGCVSALSRSVAEGFSKASRTLVEALSKDCRTSLEQQSNTRRRNIEKSCVCTHAKVPARGGLGLALGVVVLLFVALGKQGLAQENLSVSGKVVSAASGVAIEGATVTNKRTRIRAVTDRFGEYRVPARPDDILVYSFVGYISAEEKINGRQQITVALDSADNMLDEVEVISTGYQSIPKERATGSFVFVDSALLNRAVSTDIISRLKGVVPSLLFDERAGGDPKLSIRGRSTIFANADPLIVVDNFPYEGDIRNINPNDVESVSILRDAAAASIWGVRAGNGVIVITTKKGKAGQPLQVSFNGNVTVGEKPDLWYEPQLSSKEQIGLESYLLEIGHYKNKLDNNSTFPEVPPVAELLADSTLNGTEKQRLLTEWANNDIRHEMLNLFYRPSIRQQYALRISGAGNTHRFYLSAGYDHNRSHIVKEGDKRYTLNSRTTIDLLPGLEMEGGLFVVHNTQQARGGSRAISFVDNTYPYQRLVDIENRPLPITYGLRTSFADQAESNGRLNWRYYPLEEIDNIRIGNVSNSYRANARLRYTPGSGFHVEAIYQFERQSTGTDQMFEESSYVVRDAINRYMDITNGRTTYPVPLGGMLHRGDMNLNAHNTRLQVNYDYDLGPGRLNALVGLEIRELQSKEFSNSFFGYSPENGTSVPVNLDTRYTTYPSGTQRISALAQQSANGYLERFRSLFFNGSYNLSSNYAFTASARMDQTNLFGVKANQRTIPLWSVGFKWNIAKENFYALRHIPVLAIRATYGYNGNFDQNAKAYVTAQYRVNQYGIREAVLGALPNPQLRGERTSVLNFGVDLAGTDENVLMRLDYYDRRGVDLIGSAPIDATVGKTTFRGNQANMTGRGFEAEVQFNNRMGAVQWNAGLLASLNIDKVTKYLTNHRNFFMDASLLGHSISPVEGRPLFGVYSLPWGGLDAENGNPVGFLDGVPSQDYVGIMNGIASASDLIYHGPARPRFFGALRNDFSFRGFSLSVNVTYKFGYYFRRSSVHYGQLLGASRVHHADYALRWQNPGDETHTDVPSFVYPANISRDNFYLNSSPLVERGDHVRLQDLRVSYLYRKWQVYSYINNIGVIWRANRKGLDPDFNSNSEMGNTTLPLPRTVSLGFNYTF